MMFGKRPSIIEPLGDKPDMLKSSPRAEISARGEVPSERLQVNSIETLWDILNDIQDCIGREHYETARIWRYIAIRWIETSDYTEREKEYYRGQMDYFITVCFMNKIGNCK